MNREDWEASVASTGEARLVENPSLGAEFSGDGGPSGSSPQGPRLAYTVAMPRPESHLFEVMLHVSHWDCEQPLDLKMPVWTPGSYLVREYARHVQHFTAVSELGQSLPWRKLSKNHWQVTVEGQTAITICYQVYANELTVRTNHLDSTHGYFNGAALFFYLPGYDRQPIHLTVIPPIEDWRVITALPRLNQTANTFLAQDFDTLVDSPVEVGQHQQYEFEVSGKPHQLVIWGEGNFAAETLVTDIAKIVQTEERLFGGLPYDRYLFLLHLSSNAFGGLEHKDSCSLIYQRFGFRQRDKYQRFIQLVAHEFFHLWNVKRIRPQALEVFDYDQENYTPSLWFSEGTTSFYDLVIPYRAGIYGIGTYLNLLGQEITRFMTTPGRLVQPLAESSFDAWIKLYRQDAHSPNSQISYYLKGEMVSLLLDLLIRSRHDNRRSLDDVMVQMWQQFGQPEVGFTPEQLEQVITDVAACDLEDFFHRYLHTTEELPFDDYLAPFGLMLTSDPGGEEGPPFLGMTVKHEHGQDVVKFVETGSPAQLAGLDAGDILLAMDGLRVTAEQLTDRLQDYQTGDALRLTFFHHDELRSGQAVLAPPRPTRYQVVPVAKPSPEQQSQFQGWLNVSLSDIQSVAIL